MTLPAIHGLIVSTLVGLTIASCTIGDSLIPPGEDAGAGEDAAPRCSPGQPVGDGRTLSRCGGDGLTREDPTVCPSACDARLGCVACVPGARQCAGSVSMVCRADGSGLDRGRDCGEWSSTCGEDGYCEDACAAPERTRSNEGCEYFAVPLALWGNSVGDDSAAFDFRVLLANPTDSAARVEITMRGVPVRSERVEARSTLVVPLPYGENGRLPEGRSGIVAAGAYRLRSDRPLIVAQFNPFEYAEPSPPPGPEGDNHSQSADASLLLPVHTLGRSYLGLSYVPLASRITFTGGWQGTSVQEIVHRGYLAVVGVDEEPTEVRVRATTAIDGGGAIRSAAAGQELRFRVGRGEVAYLSPPRPPTCDASRPGHTWDDPPACVEETPAPPEPRCRVGEYCREDAFDLTGTTIESDRPVAVFGGHECAFVPYDRWACDHLEEQLPPVATLGRRYTSRTLGWPDRASPNVVRVVAAHDDTSVRLLPESLGIEERILDAGQQLEVELTGAFRVEATHPVLVAQLMIGQGDVQASSEPQRGDPSLVVLPPEEQYRNTYYITLPSSYREETNGQSYLLIARPAGTTVELDGVPIEGAAVERVDSDEVLIVPVEGGAHRITGSSEFGVVMYGIGTYTSYATPAGLGLRTLF